MVKEEIRWKGTPVLRDAVCLGNRTFVISSGFVKTAKLKNEWQEDVDNPDEVIRSLKRAPTKIDMLRFWQRIPERYGEIPLLQGMVGRRRDPHCDFQAMVGETD